MSKLDVLTKEHETAAEKISVLEKENGKLRQGLSALQEKIIAWNTTEKNWKNVFETHDAEITDLQNTYGNLSMQ
jgi:chromosome segregation ATPase